MPPKTFPPHKQRLTLGQLTTYDDILTDALVDHVYYWTTIRKMRKAYHPSRGIREEDITSILQKAIVLERDPSSAEAQLLALPALRRFLEGLKSEKEKDDFRKHLRRYINVYMPDCPFEVASTNRYTIMSHEASIVARRLIKKGETVKYLCGVQVVMTAEEEESIKHQKRDFSVVVSSRNKAASLFLGPARFANHDCGANARLMTSGVTGMDIIAARNIQTGDEVTVTYGDNYFGDDNCECLCKTCEERLENGWEQVEGSHVALKPSIEHDTSTEIKGPVTRRRIETAASSRTPSTTPDLRPRVLKRTPGKVARSNTQLSSPAKSQLSMSSPEPTLKRKYTLEGEPYGSSTTTKKQKLEIADIKREDIFPEDNSALYSTPASSRADSRKSSPSSSPGDVNNTTDATSMDDEPAKTPFLASNIRAKRGCLAGKVKPALDQVEAGEAIIVDPSTSIDHPAIEAAVSAEDLIVVPPRLVRKLKRPSTRLLTKTLSKLGKNARAAKKAVKESSPENEPEPVQRKPGDYVLTPLLLAQPASAWISCTVCDEYFVQLDAYYTRSACPRCERHSKLYGYQWPKTDKEGRHDEEERVLDHRTIHRFVRHDDERLVRKKDKGSMSRSTSTVEEATPSMSQEPVPEPEPVGRRSGRVRKRKDRYSL